MQLVVLAGLCLIVLSGCSSTTRTGWSRAPDLSVYSAMDTAGELAREREVLCRGRNPAEVEEDWLTRFGEREDWIAAALISRYGAPAVEQAESRTTSREPCAWWDARRWHRHHARMLKLLELRLYPKDYWSAY